MSAPGTISRALVRQRVAEAILTAMGSAGWAQSPIPWDQFGTGEGDNLLHKCFAVGCPPEPGTTFLPSRQRVGEGVPVETAVSVRWAYNLAALDQITSYDEGLEAGENIARAARTIHGVTAAILVGLTQAVDDQGWMQGEVTLRVLHLFSLT